MKQFLHKLWKDEEGAEIVEWIVVVAAIVGLTAAAFFLLGGDIENAINELRDDISSAFE